MIIVGTGDWHASKKTPENRLDDYWETWKRKANFIVDYANQIRADAIIQPGDLMDSATVPYDVTGEVAQIIQKFNGVFFSIEGQHDLRFHNPNNINRPHWVLQITQALTKLNSGAAISDNVAFFGASWEEAIPEPIPGKINVLAIHTMVIPDSQSKIWEGQETDSYVLGNRLLRKHPFEIIISGDNHQGFINEYKGRYLFNCGSLMRSTTAQVDHEPFFVVIDTDTQKYEKIMIPIEPADLVLNLEAKERETLRDERLELFIENLKATESASLDFQTTVFQLLGQQETMNPAIRGMIESFFE